MNAPAPLLFVVERLGSLRERMVFVGGMVRGLLITDRGAAPERPTDDVDAIVKVTSHLELHRLGNELRRLGFREDASEGAPICRWIIDDVKVDVMPTDGAVLGFRNRWYGEAVVHSIEVECQGQRFQIVNAPYFCATKLDAFADRGDGDFYHHDLEDVIAIVDGRSELHSELERAPGDVRGYVAQTVAALLSRTAFVESLPGHLPGDAAAQARLPAIHERLKAIAALARRGR